MLKTTVWGTEIAFSVGFPAVVALLCFFDKTGNAALCLYAALLHEAAHIAVVALYGFRPKSLCFGAFGMRMELPLLPYAITASVALAGPLCNLVFAGLSALVGWNACVVVHLALGGFNLLPFRPLDGGQALYALSVKYVEERVADRIVTAASVLTAFPLCAVAFWLVFHTGYNGSLLFLCGYLVFLLFFKKKD